MVLAIDPKFGIKSFEDLRQKKPALSIATSTNDGTNFIGHVTESFMQAHGISEGNEDADRDEGLDFMVYLRDRAGFKIRKPEK